MAGVKVESLTISYPFHKKEKNEVIHDLSASFESGKISVIIGPSGCGKTTLIKTIAGLIDEDKGKIFFDNVDVTGYTVRDRNVSLVNQNIVLYPHMTVFKNIAHPLLHTRASAEEIRLRVEEVSKLLGIEALLSRKPKEISIGQAQRVAIARAIIRRPEVYLFDEPFSNLDKELSFHIRNDLKRILNELGATAIFITHDIIEATSIGDVIYVMNEGKIVESFESDKLEEAKEQISKELIQNGIC